MILAERLGAANKAIGKRFHTYPAHPSLVRSFVKDSKHWQLQKRAGVFSHGQGPTSTVGGGLESDSGFGGRPCAMFAYIGEPMDKLEARRLLQA